MKGTSSKGGKLGGNKKWRMRAKARRISSSAGSHAKIWESQRPPDDCKGGGASQRRASVNAWAAPVRVDGCMGSDHAFHRPSKQLTMYRMKTSAVPESRPIPEADSAFVAGSEAIRWDRAGRGCNVGCG